VPQNGVQADLLSSQKPNGRPRLDMTPKDYAQAEVLRGYGLTETQIAYAIGVSPRTFTQRKADDPELVAALDRGVAIIAGQMGQALVHLALGVKVKILKKNGKPGETESAYVRAPDLQAIRYYEMTRLGQREILSVEHGIPGQADPDQLSAEDVAREVEGILSLGAARAKKAAGNGN
jgi:hypothetical protein